MSNVTLSAAMSANLLALKRTSTQMATTQLRLATGKKVNSALDNPTSYFTAVSLTDRASDLANLLDGMGQSIQTVTAASEGIDSGEKLLEQMQAVANTAMTKVPGGSVTSSTNLQYTEPTTSTVTLSAKTVSLATMSSPLTNIFAGSGTTPESQTLPSPQIGGQINLGGIGPGGIWYATYTVNNGDTLQTLSNWIGTQTSGAFTLGIANTGQLTLAVSPTINGLLDLAGDDPSLPGDPTFNDIFTNSFSTTNDYASGPGWGGTITTNGSPLCVYNPPTTADSSSLLSLITPAAGSAITAGDSLTVQLGVGAPTTINYNPPVSPQSIGDLISTLNTIPNVSAGIDSNGNLSVSAPPGVDLTFGGTMAAKLGLQNVAAVTPPPTVAATAGSFLPYIVSATGSAITASDSLTIQTGSNQSTTITYSPPSPPVNINDLINEIDGIHNLSATIDSAGNLSISAKSGQDLNFSGTMAAKLGLKNVTANPATSVAGEEAQFDMLMSQYDMLIRDASYQGINLISGTDNMPLKTIFNEKATDQSNLVIDAVDLTSKSLALTIATGNWNDADADAVDGSLNELQAAKNVLRQSSATLGENLTVIKTRRGFTTGIINTLQTGAGDLTDADVNEEGANMLAEQTQQQLGLSSLSLASKSAQSILKMFP